MSAEPELIDFIEQARKMGHTDEEIYNLLEENGWERGDIDEGIWVANQEFEKKELKTNVDENIKNIKKYNFTITLDEDVVKTLKNRAKKSMMDINSLISDIIRRSCVSSVMNKKPYNEKLDDLFINIFSRRRKTKKVKY